MTSLLIIIGKCIIFISRFLNLGNGSTWPGHIALNLNKNFTKEIIKTNSHIKIILIAGTNGKTTTVKLIQTILENANYKVFQNESGANLLNGIASSLLLHSSILSTISYDYAIFEVDENTLPLALKEIIPDYLILLNLFRDQLDRYGEVNTIANKWEDAISHLHPKTKFILNADDPQIAYLARYSGKRSASRIPNGDKRFWTSQNDGFVRTVLYFGLEDKKLSIKRHQHAVDSTYCPNCGTKLTYDIIYYSHLGDWKCKKCKLKRPNLDISNIKYYPVSGTYNSYNTLAAVLLAKQIGVEQKTIDIALHEFTPAFGRQEVLNINGKKVQIFLSKNPTSFNESLRTIADLNAKNVLLVLNDRIPDGLDVSWIWDVDFENYVDEFRHIAVSGDRTYDIALRIKYTQETQKSKVKIYENIRMAIAYSLKENNEKETLYILPTYSAMLEVRKILTGKKIS